MMFWESLSGFDGPNVRDPSKYESARVLYVLQQDFTFELLTCIVAGANSEAS